MPYYTRRLFYFRFSSSSEDVGMEDWSNYSNYFWLVITIEIAHQIEEIQRKNEVGGVRRKGFQETGD